LCTSTGEGGKQRERTIDMSGPKLIHIGRKEGRIPSTMNHRLDYVTQAVQDTSRQAILRIGQIGLDDL
jgi:hypothetical protein